MNWKALTIGAVAPTLCVAAVWAATSTSTDFESGEDGWVGPTGPGGSTSVDPTNGVDGSAGFRTEFQDFGITFLNDSNADYLGDYTGSGPVTFSVSVKVDQLGLFLPTSRPFMLELRDFDNLGDAPWTSVYYVFDWVSEGTHSDYVTYSVTIDDPTSTTLPEGWGGYGSEDPETFEPILPDGVTFADVLADVDAVAIGTLQPGFFFTEEYFDVTIDDISLTFGTTACPGDANGDNTVDLADLLLVIGEWGSIGAGFDGDVNDDESVDLADLLEVIGAWGSTCS